MPTESPFLGVEEARRLCCDLIGAEQERLTREGRLAPEHRIAALAVGRPLEALDDLEVDEATLGFDSLSRLDLVAALARYFGLQATGIEDYLLVRLRLGEWATLVADHFARVGPAAQITFSTSGSTAEPKRITHTRAALEDEVAAIAAEVLEDWPREGRVLSWVPPRHVYGFLWSVLLPRLTGRVCVDLAGAAPSRVAREVRAGDVVLATPFLWRRLAQVGGAVGKGVTGVTSGGPSDLGTWAAAKRLGLREMIEVYGATETGGIGTRRRGDAPFTLMPHLIPTDAAPVRRADGLALDVQDRLVWSGPRHFAVAGRKDGIVQVGGANVSPDAVRRALMETGLAGDAAVRLSGERLKAFVVPRDASEEPIALETALRAALAHLPAPARPDRFTFGAALPRNAMGKLQDW